MSRDTLEIMKSRGILTRGKVVPREIGALSQAALAQLASQLAESIPEPKGGPIGTRSPYVNSAAPDLAVVEPMLDEWFGAVQ